MLDIAQSVIQYLIGIQLHPLVTVVVLIVIAIGRDRWEGLHLRASKEAWESAAKATPEEAKLLTLAARGSEKDAARAANTVLLVGLAVSMAGQLALYWPKDPQTAAICLFMSLAQVGVASFGYSYAEKWGIMDRVGKIIQRKIDEKGGPGGPVGPAATV